MIAQKFVSNGIFGEEIFSENSGCCSLPFGSNREIMDGDEPEIVEYGGRGDCRFPVSEREAGG